MAVRDRALQILDLFLQEGIGQRPVVFVCHSLGGLVVKRLLRIAAESPDTYRGFHGATRAILFLATPHQGSNLASLVDRFRIALGSTVSVEELRENSAELRDLHEWYKNNADALGIDTVTYYESEAPPSLPLVCDAITSHPGVGKAVALDEDHFSIAKPETRSAQQYRASLRMAKEAHKRMAISGTVPASVLVGRSEIQAATETVVTDAVGGVTQTHFLSNPVRVEDDILGRIVRGETDAPGLHAVNRLIAIETEADRAFAERSVALSADTERAIHVRAFHTIGLPRNVDRVPNVVASSSAAVVTFPARRDGATFGLMIRDRVAVRLIQDWLSGLGAALPDGVAAIEEARTQQQKRRQQSEWMVRTLAWRVVYEFGAAIECVSLIGSSVEDAATSPGGDLDVVIVLTDTSAAIAPRLIAVATEIAEFFSTGAQPYEVNALEGPVYDTLDVGHKSTLIHILANTRQSVLRWPSHIARMRYAQHRDLHGSLSTLLEHRGPPKLVHYVDDAFGVAGLAKALRRRRIQYRTWSANGSRVSVPYMLDSPRVLACFASYAIIKSCSNIVDLLANGAFYDSWDGSIAALDLEIQARLSPELATRFREARTLQVALRRGVAGPSQEEADEYVEVALETLARLEEIARGIGA